MADSEPDTEAGDESSGYEGEETSAVSSPRASEDEEADDYSEEEVPSRRSAGRKKDGRTSKASKGQELWRPGVKTGLGPGKQVLIKIPKAREAGKIPYRDDTIHPNTLLFLRDLADNNDREWLKSKLSHSVHCLWIHAILTIVMAIYLLKPKLFSVRCRLPNIKE